MSGDGEMPLVNLRDSLLQYPNFALVNICVYHPADSFVELLIKISPLLVTFVQMTIPLALLAADPPDHDTICPASASPPEKALMAAIAVMYFYRSLLMFTSRLRQTCAGKPRGDSFRSPQNRFHGTVLNSYGQFDEFMLITYEGSVYLLNMWLYSLRPLLKTWCSTHWRWSSSSS